MTAAYIEFFVFIYLFIFVVIEFVYGQIHPLHKRKY